MNRMLAGPEDWSQPGHPDHGTAEGGHSPARDGTAPGCVAAQGGAGSTVLVLTLTGLVLVNYLNPARWLRVPTEFGTLVISGFENHDGSAAARRLHQGSARIRSHRRLGIAGHASNPTIVEMKEISGRMDMEDKSKVTLTAVEGVYDTKADLLKLNQEILIVSTAGYQGRLMEAKSRSRRAVSFPKSRCR